MTAVYEVQAGIWRPGKRVFVKGDIIGADELAAIGPVDSYRRLGLITEVIDAVLDPDDLTGLRKTDLVELAGTYGIDPDGLTKAQLITALTKGEDS